MGRPNELSSFKMSRRAFLRFCAAMGMGAVASACGPSPSQPPTPTEVILPPRPTRTVEQVSLTYWQCMTGIEEIESKILDLFVKRYPYVDLTSAFVARDQYISKIDAALASGNGPDMWNLRPHQCYDYILKGQLMDLGFYVGRDLEMTLAVGGFYVSALSGFDFRETYYGLPRDLSTVVAFFNRDLFSQAGIDPPPLDGDWIWDDLLEMAKAVTADTDGDGKVDVWGCAPFRNTWWLDPVIAGDGGQAFDGEFRRDLAGMTPNYDDPAVCDTLRFFIDLTQTHKVAMPLDELDEAVDPFTTGQAAMTWGLNAKMLQYKEASFDWDVTVLPKGTVDQFTYGYGNGVVVSSGFKDPDLAWNLALWMMEPGLGKAYLEAINAIPLEKTYAESDDFLQRFPGKNLPAFLTSAEIARNIFTVGFEEWKKAEQAEFDRALRGELSLDEACTTINGAINNALERIRKEAGLE